MGTRHEANDNTLLDRINRSLSSFDGIIPGDRTAIIDGVSRHVVDAEFPDMTLAVQWAMASGMVNDVTVDAPKDVLNASVTLSFTAEAFLLRLLEA